jgi:hypothetical protein
MPIWKLIIFMITGTSLGFLVEAASARIIVLKGTYTKERIHIACITAGGEPNAGRGPGGFGCKTSRGQVECNAAGECIGKCQRCGTGEIGHIKDILRPAYGRKAPSTR